MSATISTSVQTRWLPALLRGKPHEIIGDLEAPYLLRWYLLPRNRHLNIYLHHFHRSDDPDVLHDHPWDFVSILIAGRYIEITESGATLRTPGSIAVRRAEHRHRVQLLTTTPGTPQSCWSVIITGPRRRQWGFWCPSPHGQSRFVPWHQFGAAAPDPKTTPATQREAYR